MTALGSITVARVYFTCVACGLGRHPADAEGEENTDEAPAALVEPPVSSDPVP